jgi:hypothetical protein
MSKKRRQHSPELKARVGLEALKGLEPVHAIAAKFTATRGCIRSSSYAIKDTWQTRGSSTPMRSRCFSKR